MFSLRESFWFNKSRYYSTDGQDRWIADIVFPDVKNGFYVDVGSGDGVRQSNTKALDDRGWKGICIDPFPTGMDTRTARLFKDVVSSEKGHKVKFRKSGFMGGIEDDLNHTKDWVVVKNAETFELITTTLDEILSRADAPMHIQYMSIDVEGAELRALQGLSFSKYKVDAFTIEHNWEEPKRSQIRELLESKGYRNVFGRGRDDYYILSGLRGEGW
jgi:FkbM family methyltransferase